MWLSRMPGDPEEPFDHKLEMGFVIYFDSNRSFNILHENIITTWYCFVCLKFFLYN